MRLASFLEIIFYLAFIFQNNLGYSNYSFYLCHKLKTGKI